MRSSIRSSNSNRSYDKKATEWTGAARPTLKARTEARKARVTVNASKESSATGVANPRTDPKKAVEIGVGIKVVETARVAAEMAAAEEEEEVEEEAEEEAAAVGARTTTRMVARTREQLQPKRIKAQKRLLTFSDF